MNNGVRITACIVTYRNDLSELKETVDSFLQTSLPVELLVVDNSEDPEYSEKLRRSLPVKVITNQMNIGFGRAHNLGFVSSPPSDYHLVLNPDVTVSPGCPEKLTAFMDANPEIGLCMPRVLYPDGSLQYLCKLLPTPFDLLIRRFVPRCLGKFIAGRMQAYELRNLDYNRIMDVPYLSGCFMFLRRKAIERCGLFDERFFMYLEDVDLSRRIGAVCPTVYYPFAEVCHRHARSSYKSLRALFLHCRSAVRYFNKWGWLDDRERKRLNRTAAISEDRYKIPDASV